MGKRNSGDVAVVVGVAVLAALAIAGVLALAVGVLVAVGMLVAWIARGLSAAAERQAIKRTSAVVETHACAHVQLDTVVPGVFDDLITTEAEAVRIFALWAEQHDGAPVEPQRLVRATELRHRYVGRLVTTFEYRKPVELRKSAARRAPTPKPSLAGEDLWRLTEVELKKASTSFALCDGCDGAGTTACRTCIGRGIVTCSNCRGAGKAYDYAKNGSRRLMNCRVCDKRGSVTCRSCLAGRLRCGTCAGTGTLECWAVCERTTRDDVQVEPDGAAVGAAFDWCRDGLSVPDALIAKDAVVLGTLASETGLSQREVEAHTGRAWIDAHWSAIAPRPQLGERRIGQRFSHLEIPVVLVEWGQPGGPSESLVLEGLRLLAPSRGATPNPFAGVVRTTKNVALGLAAVPVIAALGYALRGAYFFRIETAVVVGLVAAASALLALSVARALRQDRLGRVFAAAALVAAVALLPAARAAEPSVEMVQAALVAGDVEAAEHALAALRAPTEDVERLGIDLGLLRLRKAKTASEARAVGSSFAVGSPEAAEAAKRVDALLVEEARTALAQHTPEQAERLLAELQDEASRSALRKEVVRYRVASCLSALNFACGRKFASESQDAAAVALVQKSLEAELARSKSALAASQRTETATEQRAAAMALRRLVEDNSDAIPDAKTEVARLRSIEDRLSKKIDAELRQREAELDRERRKAEARVRAAAPPVWQGVRCCDGTRSPTCSSRGRGCCSHHGGVCG